MRALYLSLLPLAGEGGLAQPRRMRGRADKVMETNGSRMILRRPQVQLRRAGAMRSAPTKAEEMLWRSLRANAIGIKFRRQAPIGPYIADLACLSAKLVVDLDGPPHDKPEQRERRRQRDTWFAAHGWRVLRVPNGIVSGGGDMVFNQIKVALSQVPSSVAALLRHLLPQTGEGKVGETA